MKNNLLRNTIITGAICTALVIPSFAQVAKVQPVSGEDIEIIPIRYEFAHWSETYIEQLSKNYDVKSVFKDKDLDAAITVQDFQKLVKLTVDKEYNSAPDKMTREAVVYELIKIWAEKTDLDLEKIPVIKMIIYTDTDEIDVKYNHGVTVAYMKNIAKGKGTRAFAPEANVTYGELAALINNTDKAIVNKESQVPPATDISPVANGEKNNSEKNNGDKNESEVNTQIKYELTEEGIIKPELAEKIIKETADKLIHAINTKDSAMISEFVHPAKGVRFTPYTHVSLERDVVLNKEKINNFFKDRNVYLWGYYDGKGDEISLTPSEYYEKFIYSEDFINAEEIGYNKVLSSGNMIENQFEAYESAIVVEYYFSGFNPDYAGIDWKSLRLVFEQYGDSWKLVGIIHNQWTI